MEGDDLDGSPVRAQSWRVRYRAGRNAAVAKKVRADTEVDGDTSASDLEDAIRSAVEPYQDTDRIWVELVARGSSDVTACTRIDPLDEDFTGDPGTVGSGVATVLRDLGGLVRQLVGSTIQAHQGREELVARLAHQAGGLQASELFVDQLDQADKMRAATDLAEKVLPALAPALAAWASAPTTPEELVKRFRENPETWAAVVAAMGAEDAP